MTSIGDWRYTKDFTAELFDANQQSIGEGTLYLNGAKVGNAAQTTAFLGADYRLGKVNLDMAYRYAGTFMLTMLLLMLYSLSQTMQVH